MRSLCVVFLAVVFSMAACQQLCNGYAEYCNKPYNTISQLVTHNSYGYVSNPAANQLCPITTQLEDGVRGIKLSAIKAPNATAETMGSVDSIYLCHTSCIILNAGPAVETLRSIKEWVVNHPNEVVTIMWSNVDQFEGDAFAAIYQASGILDYSYQQPMKNLTWPTLGEIIASGKRIITFADTYVQDKYPWLLTEFNYMFETSYENFNESSFSCTMDRPQEPDYPNSVMYVMNHFLYGSLQLGSLPIQIPQKGRASVTNGNDSLLKQARHCTATFGRQPNFLEVDFYNLGNALQITAELNNVTYSSLPSLKCDAYTAQIAGSPSTDSSEAIQTISVSSVSLLLTLIAAAFFIFL
ncbi:PLC-like phosphodiesterase [Sporodiniella umbellata]|nr:PLC-like phosphodiesterase [Sporodiniella umbellata]